jgi:hypothetical protein
VQASFREQVTRLLSTVTDSPIDRVDDFTVAWVRSGSQKDEQVAFSERRMPPGAPSAR